MTATIDNNTITGTKGGKGDIQVISETNTADVTVKNTAAKVTVSYKENNEQLVEEKTLTKDNTLTINENGGSNVTQPEQKPSNNYYYYAPTPDTTTKGSPKTFDAGVGIYAVTAVLSLGGMAWTAKKRH
jgi:flagellar hook assembly protein FlgD